MSTPIISERFTTEVNEPFVVFLIGARINQMTAVRRWSSVVRAMGQMLPVLYQYPQKGFLGGESFFRLFPVTTVLISYWRSFEDLERFARSKDDPHLAAWQDFYRQGGTDGKVGIWHETYMIEPGKYEVVYANMPLFGLAKATGKPMPTGGHRTKARGRVTGQHVDLAPELEVTETHQA
ncbi:MAG TPA: DUF4188 domain-containing protein [Phototrophicaceae bacterium]|jgi:hypothetical protein|nr:DUF4188 domain-containing protein [Phototrophicaceae bacterium]